MKTLLTRIIACLGAQSTALRAEARMAKAGPASGAGRVAQPVQANGSEITTRFPGRRATTLKTQNRGHGPLLQQRPALR